MLLLFDNAWGFGTEQIAAPQATLMKMIIEGVMGGDIPWALVFIGVFISASIELIGISSLTVAIGLYLPLELSTTIMIGGIIRLVVDKMKAKGSNTETNEEAGSGILFCSGMIAGEGLVGILLAAAAILGIDSSMNISGIVNTGIIGGIAVIILMVVMIYIIATRKNKNEA